MSDKLISLDNLTEFKSKLKEELFKEIYPVGSIYVTYENKSVTDIQNMFGGTWVLMENTFLYSKSGSYSSTRIGGAAKVTLTAAQMPKHRHNIAQVTNGSTDNPGNHTHGFYVRRGGTGNYRSMRSDAAYQDVWEQYWPADNLTGAGEHIHTVTIPSHNTDYDKSSAATAHENMPPYTEVKIFRRTAL